MTRQRTSAEIEAGARALYQNRSQTRWVWEELEPKQRQHFLAVAQDTYLAADAAAAPPVGVTVDEAETAIEAARELLLMLHLEVMTGASLVSPAVTALMTELDNAIFAWDAEQMEPGMGEEQS